MPNYNGISPLFEWINGLCSFNQLLETRKSTQFSYMNFLTIEKCHDFHTIHKIKGESLVEKWIEINEYIKKSLSIVYVASGENPADVYIDNEDRFDIISSLGAPPAPAFPIYLISVEDEEKERLVYVGKNNSKHSRFKDGHKAAIRLHNPRYKSSFIRLYQCRVILFDEYEKCLPLEFLYSLDESKKLLKEIESHMIFQFKPDLNTQGIKNLKNPSRHSFQIVNYSERSSFLNEENIWAL